MCSNMQLAIYKKYCPAILTIFPIFFSYVSYADEQATARSALKADLRFRLGIYREEELKSSALKGLLKKKSDESTEAATTSVRDFRSLLNNKGNYSALADITYSLNANVLGNFGATLGYSYKSESTEKNPFDDIKKKIKSLSCPYAELSWEKSGILFIESMTLRSGATIMGKRTKGKGFPVFLSSGLAYRIGGMTAVYAGVQYPMYFPSFKTEDEASPKVVFGIEFAL